jgi:hypothetical protein
LIVFFALEALRCVQHRRCGIFVVTRRKGSSSSVQERHLPGLANTYDAWCIFKSIGDDFPMMPPLTGLEWLGCRLLQRCHTYGVWNSRPGVDCKRQRRGAAYNLADAETKTC